MRLTKNYADNGGDRWVIGGELHLKEGVVISGEGAADLAAVATETTLGGVKAAAKGAGDTVEAKIGADGKLYVPAYPAVYELPAASADVIGGVKLVANQTAIAADADLDALRTAYIDLVAKLKAAGVMADDT